MSSSGFIYIFTIGLVLFFLINLTPHSTVLLYRTPHSTVLLYGTPHSTVLLYGTPHSTVLLYGYNFQENIINL